MSDLYDERQRETTPDSPYSTALPDRTGYWYRLYVEPTTGNWIDVVESVTVVDGVDGSEKAMLEWRDSVGNLKFTELVESHDCYWARVVMPPWPIAEMDETCLGPIEDMEQL